MTQEGEANITGISVEGRIVVGDPGLDARWCVLDTENEFGEQICYLPGKQASATSCIHPLFSLLFHPSV